MYTMCNESYWDDTKFDIRIEQFLKCQYLFLLPLNFTYLH